jgi:hypothetical protein
LDVKPLAVGWPGELVAGKVISTADVYFCHTLRISKPPNGFPSFGGFIIFNPKLTDASWVGSGNFSTLKDCF